MSDDHEYSKHDGWQVNPYESVQDHLAKLGVVPAAPAENTVPVDSEALLTHMCMSAAQVMTSHLMDKNTHDLLFWFSSVIIGEAREFLKGNR